MRELYDEKERVFQRRSQIVGLLSFPPLRVGRGPEDSTLCLGYGQLDEEPREKVHRLENFFEIALGPISSSPRHKSARTTASRFSSAIPNGRLARNLLTDAVTATGIVIPPWYPAGLHR